MSETEKISPLQSRLKQWCIWIEAKSWLSILIAPFAAFIGACFAGSFAALLFMLTAHMGHTAAFIGISIASAIVGFGFVFCGSFFVPAQFRLWVSLLLLFLGVALYVLLRGGQSDEGVSMPIFPLVACVVGGIAVLLMQWYFIRRRHI